MSALTVLTEPKRPPQPQPAPAPAEKTRSATDAFLIFARRQVDLGLAEWCKTPSGEMGFRWIEPDEQAQREANSKQKARKAHG